MFQKKGFLHNQPKWNDPAVGLESSFFDHLQVKYPFLVHSEDIHGGFEVDIEEKNPHILGTLNFLQDFIWI